MSSSAETTPGAHRLSRRELLVAVGASAVAAPLVGAGAAGAAAGGKTIGFELSNFGVPRYKNVDLPAFQKAVKALGYDVLWNQSDADVAKEAANVENMLTKGISVLVLQPYVGRSAVALVRKAEADGIPVIAYNDSIPSTRVKAFVGRDNVGVGALIARTGLATTGNRGNWAVVSGEAGGSVADQWTEGVMRTLKPLDKSGRIKLVTQQYLTHWDPERARRLAEDALTKTNNNMQGFLVNNDEMAFGVITALEAQGLAGKVWVGGQDATEQGCRAMLQGTMTASAFTRFDGMGRTAGQLAVQLARGKPLTSDFKFEGVPWFKVESFIVTKRNLVPYLRQYSPQYVNAKHVFRGIPETQWPPGAKALLAKSG